MSTELVYSKHNSDQISFVNNDEEVILSISWMNPSDSLCLGKIQSTAFKISAVTLVRTPISINKTCYQIKGDDTVVELQSEIHEMTIKIFDGFKQQAVNKQISVSRMEDTVIIKQI